MPSPDWPADPQQLRLEVHALRDALIAALDARVPVRAVRGVYFKGSASKPWHAPLDYVPELSDLDLHVWFHDDAAPGWLARFREAVFALEFAQDAEDRFSQACPAPLHMPRPQLLLLNGVDLSGWTRSHVQVLRGEPYPGAEATAAEDRARLLEVSEQADGLGLDLLDKVGPQLWTALRQLNWRVSPLPARLLSAAGAGPGVWHAPRSVLLADLDARGFGALADELRAYYAHTWAAFGTGWRDAGLMRQAVLHALEALRQAARAVDGGEGGNA